MFSQRTIPRIFFVAILVSIAVIVSIGFSSAAAEHVRIGYTAPGPQHGLLWLGDIGGMYRE
ncbi:MAG TPA: hypothetical protein VEI95_04995 [Acidobacteriota bacterium]|nr:hypothetical protein [Acidobacteriota bacterium]